MKFNAGCGGHHACNCILDKIEELEDDIRRYKEALEYYAQGSTNQDWDLIGYDDDYGERARVALVPHELDETKEIH